MSGPVLQGQELATLAAAVLGGLALLYLLRPRRRQVEVPFGGLWQRVIAKAEARALSTRWRRLLSMLLNWLIAALMLAALGESTLGLRGCAEERSQKLHHTVLAIDTSASMATLDGRDIDGDAMGARIRRIDEAKDRAERILDAARPHERFLVVTADARIRVMSGWTDDTEAIRKVLRRVDARLAGFDANALLDAAEDALKGREDGKIALITDGGRALSPVAARRWSTVQRISVGPKRSPESGAGIDNLAVEELSARRLPADPGRGAFLVHVRNDSARPVAAVVTIAASSDAQAPAEFRSAAALKGSKVIDLPPRGAKAVRFDSVPLDATRFSASIRPVDGARFTDLARYDDMGFAVVAGRRRLKVLLVTAGNLFLEAALHVDPRRHVTRIGPDAYQPDRYAAAGKDGHGIDVVVLDQVGRPAPEGTPALVFDKAGLPGGAPRMLTAVDLVARSPEHPVVQGVTFSDVNIDKARALQLASGDEVLAADAGGSAVIVANTAQARRVTVGVDLLDSDIGGRFTMPLLVSNAIDWLAGEDEPLVAPLPLGEVFSVEVPVQGGRWRWRLPAGKDRDARVAGGLITGTTTAAGVHVWRSAGHQVERPTRLPAIERPDDLPPAQHAWKAPPDREQRRNQPPPRQLWMQLLLAAMLAFSLEWLLYNRRRTV